MRSRRALQFMIVACVSAIASILQADAMRPYAIPMVFAAPMGQYYLKLVPRSTDPREGGTGEVYRVTAGTDPLVYAFEGWYSDRVAISWDGECIVYVGSPIPLGDDDAENHVILGFLRNGKPVKSYAMPDLYPDPESVSTSTSYYRHFDEFYVPGASRTVRVRTGDSRILSFDQCTGELTRSVRVAPSYQTGWPGQ